jgi:tetratricopeptide (TPR) repeat protein
LKIRWLGLVAVLAAVCVAAPAHARNPNISGGILRVTQANKEKEKKNFDEAQRLYGTAVKALSTGLAEDPKDIEAWDYLGVAYGELDSTARAGFAFSEGIKAATAGGSEKKKLLDRMIDNRRYFWVKHFNDGLGSYREATAVEGQVDEAKLNQGIAQMRSAIEIDPSAPQAYCTLAAFLVNAKRVPEAAEVVRQGLAIAPQDSCLNERKSVVAVVEGEEAAKTGDFSKAIAPYEAMLAKDPSDSGAALRLGELYFQQGEAYETRMEAAADDASKKQLGQQARDAFAKAADGFGAYHKSKPEDDAGRFNYAVALSRSGQFEKLGQLAQSTLLTSPSLPEYHSFLATAYREMGNEEASTAHTLMARMLKEGTKVDDPAAVAQKSVDTYGATSNAASTLKEWGAPEEVRTHQMGDYPVEAWFWWTAKRGAIFSKGAKVATADFSTLQAATPKTAVPAGAKKK